MFKEKNGTPILRKSSQGRVLETCDRFFETHIEDPKIRRNLRNMTRANLAAVYQHVKKPHTTDIFPNPEERLKGIYQGLVAVDQIDLAVSLLEYRTMALIGQKVDDTIYDEIPRLFPFSKTLWQGILKYLEAMAKNGEFISDPSERMRGNLEILCSLEILKIGVAADFLDLQSAMYFVSTEDWL